MHSGIVNGYHCCVMLIMCLNHIGELQFYFYFTMGMSLVKESRGPIVSRPSTCMPIFLYDLSLFMIIYFYNLIISTYNAKCANVLRTLKSFLRCRAKFSVTLSKVHCCGCVIFRRRQYQHVKGHETKHLSYIPKRNIMLLWLLYKIFSH